MDELTETCTASYLYFGVTGEPFLPPSESCGITINRLRITLKWIRFTSPRCHLYALFLPERECLECKITPLHVILLIIYLFYNDHDYSGVFVSVFH